MKRGMSESELPNVDGIWAVAAGVIGAVWGSARSHFGLKGRVDTHDVLFEKLDNRLDKMDEKLDRLVNRGHAHDIR